MTLNGRFCSVRVFGKYPGIYVVNGPRNLLITFFVSCLSPGIQSFSLKFVYLPYEWFSDGREKLIFNLVKV